MREKILDTIARWAGEKTWWMFLGIIIITIIMGALAGQLEMNMNLTMLLPENDPMVNEFNKIFKEFNGANTVFVVVEGEQRNMKKFAEYITPKILNLENWIEQNASSKVKKQHNALITKTNEGKTGYTGNYFDRVDYKMPTEFIKNHGLMLVKSSDLKNTGEVFTNPNIVKLLKNINNSLEKEYIQSEEKISTTQKERSAVQFLDGIESWLDNTAKGLYYSEYKKQYATKAANAIGVGNPYFISPDRSMLLIMAEPTFSIMDMNCVMPGINGLEEMVKTESTQFNVKAGLAGGVVLGRDEMVAGTEDSYLLTILALIAIFILFIFTFRMFSAPLLAMFNLLIGIVWVMGVAYLLVQRLNLFTLMVSVILVGLGIDFSIHIISLFSEYVNKGVEPKKAIRITLQKAGTGIITGGITTAAAFLTLCIGRSEGISEFGLVNGVGLLCIMIATIITLPTFLMLREKYRNWRGKSIKKYHDVTYAAIGDIAQKQYNKWKVSLISLIFVTLILGYFITKVTFDYNYLNMEPVGIESIKLNDKIIDKYNMSSDATCITANSLQENYKFAEEAKEKSSVSYIESITDYLPPKDKQKSRKQKIANIHKQMENQTIAQKITEVDWQKFIDEMIRLEDNVIEMQDMAFIGGQDMVDTKAARLVGNANISRAVVDLEDLLFNPADSEINNKIKNICKMLNFVKSKKENPGIKNELSELINKLSAFSKNSVSLSKDEKIEKLKKYDDKLTQITEYPEFKGRISEFITQLTNNSDKLERLSKFNHDFALEYKNLILNMADTSNITLSMLPDFIRDKYISKSGKVFLLSVYPKGNIWNLKYLDLFSNEMFEISHRIVGTAPMFYYLIKIIGRDGRNAAFLTLFVVFIFLLIDFKSFKSALLAMIPLLTGMIWMLGLMGIFHVQLTLVNIMALPLILGIGVDDGVHILHRYRIEGTGTIKTVFASTGKAIIITSLTTMLSFGSLVFATYRGYGSLGIALFIGVGACLLTSLLILPTILGMVDRKKKK